jgi:CheY-like chemotaxis protein
VLVVDDMPVNLRVASGLLEPHGLKVDTATSGLEAIEKLKQMNSNTTDEKYDLIFMDHMMPGMDGIKAVRHIRNEIGGLNTKLGIAATGGKAERLAVLVKNIHAALEAGNTRANSETSPSENTPSSLTPLLRPLLRELLPLS